MCVWVSAWTLFARGEGGVSFAKNGLTEEAGEIKNLIGALRIPFPLRSYLAHAGIAQHGREKLRVLVMNELRMPVFGACGSSTVGLELTDDCYS